MNLLSAYNSRFYNGIADWDDSGGGVYSAALGYPREGCALLADGETIASASISLSADYPYAIHLFARLDLAATLAISSGALSIDPIVGVYDPPIWVEICQPFAVSAAQAAPIALSAAGGNVYLDTITVYSGVLPMRRSEAASVAHQTLGELATDANLSTTPSSAGPEGDYTLAIDEALRSIGAVDMHGAPDITLVTVEDIGGVYTAIRASMLEQLQIEYALEADVTLGPRTERRSQISDNLGGLIGGDSGGGASGLIVRDFERDDTGWQR